MNDVYVMCPTTAPNARVEIMPGLHSVPGSRFSMKAKPSAGEFEHQMVNGFLRELGKSRIEL
jgi:hypothetical protein